MAISNTTLANVSFNTIFRNASGAEAAVILLDNGFISSIPDDIPSDLRAFGLLDWLFYHQSAFSTDEQLCSDGDPDNGYSGSTATGLDYTRSLLLNSKKPYQVRNELEDLFDADKSAFCASYFADPQILRWIGQTNPTSHDWDTASNFTSYTWPLNSADPNATTTAYPRLKGAVPVHSLYVGSVASGSNTTTTFATSTIASSANHLGNAIAFTYGSVAPCVRTITAMSAGSVTVYPPLPSIPQVGDRFFCPSRPADIKAVTDSMEAGYRYILYGSSGLGGVAAQPAATVSGSYFGAFFDNEFKPSFQGNVSGAANNGSGLIRITTPGVHGLATGDCVIMQGVGGVSAASGTWLVTVIDTTHFDLQGSTFSGTFTSGGYYRQPYKWWMDTWEALMPDVFDIWWKKYIEIGGQVDEIAFNSERTLGLWTVSGLKEFQYAVLDSHAAGMSAKLGFTFTDSSLLNTLKQSSTDLRTLLFTAWHSNYIGGKLQQLVDIIHSHIGGVPIHCYDEMGRDAPGCFLDRLAITNTDPAFGVMPGVGDRTSKGPYGTFDRAWDPRLGTNTYPAGGSGQLTQTSSNTAKWNSFIYDFGIRQRHQQIATTKRPVTWMIWKTYPAGFYPTATWYNSNLFYDGVFHSLLQGGDVAFYLSGTTGDQALIDQNALAEAESVLQWETITPELYQDPPEWDAPYFISKADTGGKYIYYLTPKLGSSVTVTPGDPLTISFDSTTLTFPKAVTANPVGTLGTGYWIVQTPTRPILTDVIASRLVAADVYTGNLVYSTIDPYEKPSYPPSIGGFCVLSPGSYESQFALGGGRYVMCVSGTISIVIWLSETLDNPRRETIYLQQLYEQVYRVIDALEQWYDGSFIVEPMRLTHIGDPSRPVNQPKWGYIETTWEVTWQPPLSAAIP